MRELYRSGLTLRQVGDVFGISGSAVRECIPDEPARRRRLKRNGRDPQPPKGTLPYDDGEFVDEGFGGKGPDGADESFGL